MCDDLKSQNDDEEEFEEEESKDVALPMLPNNSSVNVNEVTKAHSLSNK